LEKDYLAAIEVYRKAVELWCILNRENQDVSVGLNDLAEAERLHGDLDDAERDFLEALRIAKAIDYRDGVATYTGNLATLALDRNDWPGAEVLAREALSLAARVGRQGLIASNCRRLAKILVRQGKKAEAIPHARYAVEIFTRLGLHDDLGFAREILAQCES
jgi:tetratricopeptide (TPR) repeat protein